MTFKMEIELPAFELDLDEGAIKREAAKAGRGSMRVQGGARGDNLKNLTSAALAGAAKEIDRQTKTRRVIK